LLRSRGVCATTVGSWVDTLDGRGHTPAIPPSKFCCSSVPMRILVAEDDAPLADFLRQRLVQEQFAVQLASDGIEAQRLAASQAFDLSEERLTELRLHLPGGLA
jgi:hypothetical protein